MLEIVLKICLVAASICSHSLQGVFTMVDVISYCVHNSSYL